MYTYLTQKQKIKAGHKYEYFISWKLRKEGWEVIPRTKYGKYDRGIDLIATKGEKLRYIQCKGWSHKRTLYENTIDQLYGSVVYQVGQVNLINTEIYLYSPTRLSSYALDHAKKLGIEYFHEPYPYWKRKKRFI